MLSFVFCEAKMIWKETSFILLSWLRYFLTLIFQCQIFFQRSSLGINHFFFHRVTSRKTKQYQIMNKIFGQGFIKQKPIMQKEGWVLTVFNVFVSLFWSAIFYFTLKHQFLPNTENWLLDIPSRIYMTSGKLHWWNLEIKKRRKENKCRKEKKKKKIKFQVQGVAKCLNILEVL